MQGLRSEVRGQIAEVKHQLSFELRASSLNRIDRTKLAARSLLLQSALLCVSVTLW
jgi:hypothetical protein